jgi:hypothetical protein
MRHSSLDSAAAEKLEIFDVEDASALWPTSSLTPIPPDCTRPSAKSPNDPDQSERERYEKEQEEIKSEADHKEAAVEIKL